MGETKEAAGVTPVVKTVVSDEVFESFVGGSFVSAGDLAVDVLFMMVLVVLPKNSIRFWRKKLL